MKVEQEVAVLIKRHPLAEGICKLVLQCPKIASRCLPGQFIRLQALAQRSILPRPLAVYQIDTRGRLEVVIRNVGLNTDLYSRLARNAEIKVSGPHGRPLEIKPEEVKWAWLVGGGGGLPALLPLAVLLKKKAGVIAGFRTQAEIFGEEDFVRSDNWFNVATDDGTKGYKGTAADLLVEQIKSFPSLKATAVYACGPAVMLKAVVQICRKNQISCFAFLEKVMACGAGACLGCSVPMADGRVKYVCKDGPVFPAEEVNWNELLKRG